jgi:ribosome-binding ATPase YchF (GTP1/OBG family)
MSFLVGVVGKTNVGKSTFFSSATRVEVEISNRIFTTIKPNHGVTYASHPCACKDFGVNCSPKQGKCANGTRYIPIELLDVAGLVPGAHEGKGLGNQFLSDLSRAHALIHVIDISGSTDSTGNPCKSGTHDPEEDITFLQEEIVYWMEDVLKRNNEKISKALKAPGRKPIDVLSEQLSGLLVTRDMVERIVNKVGMPEDNYREFARSIIEISKPRIIAANKADLPGAKENLERLGKNYNLIPTCAEAELALRKASEKGIIEYMPGDSSFRILKVQDERQKKALDWISDNVLGVYGSTGVQKVIDTAVFSLLDMIVAYPVEDESKLCDSKGNVLPDALLLKRGSTPFDLAGAVHTDFQKSFIGAIDCRKKMKVGKDYAVKDRDVLKILIKS